MRAAGYQLQTIPFTGWRDELTARAHRGEANALAPLVPLFWIDTFEPIEPLFDCEVTWAALAELGVPRLAPDAHLLQRCIDFFLDSGFLEPPPGGGS